MWYPSGENWIMGDIDMAYRYHRPPILQENLVATFSCNSASRAVYMRHHFQLGRGPYIQRFTHSHKSRRPAFILHWCTGAARTHDTGQQSGDLLDWPCTKYLTRASSRSRKPSVVTVPYPYGFGAFHDNCGETYNQGIIKVDILCLLTVATSYFRTISPN